MFEIFVYSTRFEGVHLRGGQGRARRAALVGPARGFPHRGAGPREGADGEEHRDRPGRLEGRLRAEARARRDRPRGVHEGGDRLLPGLPPRPARPHRQPGRRRDRAAAAGQAPRRRRSVSRRRRGQGDRDVLRLRERDQQGVRLLARRRVRVGRLGRLRPQGDGHHRARRVGIGEAPLPRDGRRHADDGLHRRRHRRHVGRRVRQRHAAVATHQADRGVRPPPHLPRSDAGPGDELRRARAALPAAALVVGRLRREAAFPRAAASIRAARNRSRSRRRSRPRSRSRPTR